MDSIPIDKKSVLANIDSLRIASFSIGAVKFTPFIAPSYSPELELLLSAGGNLTFTFQKQNPFLARSSVPFSVGISTNGAKIFSARFNLFGSNDQTRMIGDWGARNMPDHYWGVGYSSGRNLPKSDSTTRYRRNWWRFYQKIMVRVEKNFFLGPILDFSRTQASELNSLMQEDPAVLEFGTNIRSTGLGIVAAFDSRDMPVNAYNGFYLDFSLSYYDDFLGGEQQFQVLELDYRQYKQLGDKRRVLAWNLKSRSGFGEVPWPELSQLGNPFDFRGYFWGRYRDRSMLLGVVEYRHMFDRKRPNKKGKTQTPFGFTTWSGLGAIGKDITQFNNWLPVFGLGFRFETQPRMNVRVDYGLGGGFEFFLCDV